MKKNLTEQQRTFCHEYNKGLSASAAYKKAYNTKGYSDKLISYHANKLLDNELIKQEIKERQERASSFLNYTVEDSFKKIVEIQALAEEKKDITNILKAEEMKQKLAGINKEQANLNIGIVGDFKEFYAAICAKKDYGNAKDESKTLDLSISPKN